MTCSISTFAWNNTSNKSAYSYYYGYNIANLEARVWVSTIKSNFWNTKYTFDSTSSSWVFNSDKSITKHVNSLTLKKNGISCTLSVSTSGAGGSVSEKTDSLCTIDTPAANSYYRGITTYNNIVSRGWGSTVSRYLIPSVGKISGYFTITATSNQSVYIDGQRFNNTAETTGYF